MVSSFLDKHIAIVGAGKFCERFLTFFFKTDVRAAKPVIMGVADKNRLARGIMLAEELGIPTTTDFQEFAKIEGLDIIIEMSNHPTLADAIRREMPERVQVIDHYDARTLWDMLNIQIFRDQRLSENSTGELLDDLMDRFAAILDERTNRTRLVVQNLWEQKQIIAQIVEGSTAPTFVIDRNHRVTHWNTAMEKLTQVTAEKVVGTNRQWFPFYGQPRPSLADIVLDQLDTSELSRYYDSGWDKSALIEGAYQAESFFEKLGSSGKWLFMTAAPIKAGDGEVIGAIETFWDITKNKIAVHEQERHNRDLSTLVEIYTALNAPGDFEKRLDNALSVVRDFIGAVNVCIFLKEENNGFSLRYKSGTCDYPCFQKERTAMADMVEKMEDSGQLSIYGTSRSPEMACPFARDATIQSLIYLPVNDKENNPLGVIYITSKHTAQGVEQDKDILELIGNRIGVAVENALLQEQYIKSEEKYRTLFNNDPTPIFILDKEDCRIIDMNQRAMDTYGYKLEELSGTPFTALGDPEDDEVTSGLADVTMDRSVLLSKKRHFRKGGEPFFVTIVVSVAEYGGSEILIVNTTDISEIVQKEAQLVQAAKMSTLGVMAAGMAHEINQPLNAIQICADYFMKIHKKGETVSPDDLKTMTTNIIENVDRASKVIRRVRDFARQTDVTRYKININAPIRDSVKVLNHEIKKHEIALRLDLERYIPPIMADHNRLEQVFINLISNAIDAIEEKAGQHAGRSPDSPPDNTPDNTTDKTLDKTLAITSGFTGGDVSVTVSDMGAGMSEQVQEKIFEPFFTTKETGKGTGLGVSISYGIIKDYEGEIAVESRVGVGTSITITFPAAGPPSEKS